ncbi:hypothetical protein KD909_15220 (plasmid) [Exiguobacterium sp. PFWT01]|uniref:hypothetical protein n=1 Tax=Exiguobacterium sp. PFWT01 TaxID=2829816 RepID=UPI001BAA42C0|nr:hypothetical protein [Exiguobacterium sp. PFWT01]QUP88711.1 hypothetical protein KD909_15220 [Exiguobacterium sp. PFWT01]
MTPQQLIEWNRQRAGYAPAPADKASKTERKPVNHDAYDSLRFVVVKGMSEKAAQ